MHSNYSFYRRTCRVFLLCISGFSPSFWRCQLSPFQFPHFSYFIIPHFLLCTSSPFRLFHFFFSPFAPFYPTLPPLSFHFPYSFLFLHYPPFPSLHFFTVPPLPLFLFPIYRFYLVAPGSLNRVPFLAGGKGGILTSVGWQVTLCDPIWHVSLS